MLSRRSIFGMSAGAIVAASLPAVAVAQQPDPWDVLIAGLAVIDPAFAEQAKLARAQGFEIDELHTLCRTIDQPFLMFRKTVNGVTGPHIFDGIDNGGLN